MGTGLPLCPLKGTRASKGLYAAVWELQEGKQTWRGGGGELLCTHTHTGAHLCIRRLISMQVYT